MSSGGSFFSSLLTVVGAVVSVIPGYQALGYWLMAAGTATNAINAREESRRARNTARRDYNAGLEDRLEMVDVTPDQARTMVYGRVRTVDGVRRRWVSGENNKRLTMVVSFAGHEIDGFEAFYFDDVELQLDAQGYVLTEPYNKARPESFDLSGSAEPDGTVVVTLPGLLVAGSVSGTWSAGSGQDTQTGALELVSVVGQTATFNGAVFGATYYVSGQATVSSRTARIRFYTGAPGQNVGAVLAAEYPGKITATDRFEGMAVAVVDIDYDPDVYTQGRPNVTARLRGARVYDPRLDSTAGGSGPHRLAVPSTHTFSENPALQSTHFVLSPTGWAVPAADVNMADVVAAANACDVATAFTLRKTGNVLETVNLPRYRSGMVIKSEGSRRDGLDELMKAMAGRWGWSGGQWRFRAGVMRGATFALQPSWIAQRLNEAGEPDGGAVLRLTNGLTREQRVNRVTGRCVDPAQRWQALPFPAIQDNVLVAQDGAVYPLETELSAVNHPAHAQHLGSITIRETQAALRLSAQCNVSAFRCELFDVGTVTLPRVGMDGKTFEVVGWRWHPAEGVNLTLAEITDAIFVPLAELKGVDPAPNSNLPAPWQVQAITGVTVQSGTAGLKDGSILTRTQVSWNPCTQASVLAGGSIEVQYCEVTTGEWQSWVEQGSSTQATIPGLKAGTFYLFKVRAVQGLPQVRGPWSLQVQHQVANVPIVDGRYTSFIFRRSATQPATPTGINPVGWFDQPPAADGNPLWFSLADKASDDSLISGWAVPVAIDGEALQVEYGVSSIGPWFATFTPGDLYARYRVGAAGVWSLGIKIVGEDGLTPVYIFRRAASAPATPTGQFPAAWFDAPPLPNGQPLFASLNKRRADGTVVGPWSAPVQIEGDSIYVEYSVDGVTGWHPVFVPGSDVWARYKTGTAGSWSAAVKIVGEDGQPGANGTRLAVMTLRQWASSVPTVFPSGTSNYTWATGNFTTPSGAGAWAQNPGAPLNGQTLYECQQRQADNGTAPVTGIPWNTTTAYVVGRAGNDGIRGNVTGYSASVSPPIFSVSPWNGATDDINARNVIWQMRGGNGSAPSNAHLVIGDTVTLRTANNSTAATKFWTGGDWAEPGVYISANFVAGGTISGLTNFSIAGYARIEGGAGFAVVEPISGSALTRNVALAANTTFSQDYGLVGYTNQSLGNGAGVYGYGANTVSGSIGVAGRGRWAVYGATMGAGGYSFYGEGRGFFSAAEGPALQASTSSGHGVIATTFDGAGDAIRATAPAGGANGQIRLRTATNGSGRGLIQRNDGAAFYLLFTDNNDANGGWTAARPLTIDFASGGVTLSQLSLRDMQLLGAGTSAANFTGTKPGGPTTNNWMLMTINSQSWLLPAWPLN
jgi:hypothetical protein